jgi:hypothetical protein
MRPGQAQLLTQQLHQQGARLDGGLDGIAVHRQRNGRHGNLLICGSNKSMADKHDGRKNANNLID